MKVAMAASELRSSAGSYVVSLTAMSLHPFIEQPFRRLDIFRPATLVPTAQQDRHRIALPVTLDAITRTTMNAQFADLLSDRAGKKFSDALPRPAASGVFRAPGADATRADAALSKRRSHADRGPCRGAGGAGGAGAAAAGDLAGRAGGAGASGRIEGHCALRRRSRTPCTISARRPRGPGAHASPGSAPRRTRRLGPVRA